MESRKRDILETKIENRNDYKPQREKIDLNWLRNIHFSLCY